MAHKSTPSRSVAGVCRHFKTKHGGGSFGHSGDLALPLSLCGGFTGRGCSLGAGLGGAETQAVHLLEHEDLEGPAALAAEHPRAGVHAAATDEPLLAESQRWFKSKSRRLLNVALFIYPSQLLKFGEVQRS